jgi:hypothetical protein
LASMTEMDMEVIPFMFSGYVNYNITD